ncbi:putative NAD(P)H nitroreductase YfhC [Tigriopus californicus]|uniref:putative NAD(P)H nitroreductase YfhC n=1 Tax=Tigriopus californicus TaxID=6832 RepID=UPI0027DA3E0A|nr:putative NAD(P)H nitroreductase YfhC [Tigriopus californicus]
MGKASLQAWMGSDLTVLSTVAVALLMMLFVIVKFGLRSSRSSRSSRSRPKPDYRHRPAPRRARKKSSHLFQADRFFEEPEERRLDDDQDDDDDEDFDDFLPDPESTLELIRHRRTISAKDCNGRTVAEDEIRMLLEAANWAPTHGQTEPWRFVVIQGPGSITDYLVYLDRWYRDRADQLPESTMQKFQKKLGSCLDTWVDKVSHLLVIVMKRQAKPDKLMPEWEEMCAVAMAVQNLHLMATSLGLAVFWSSHTWCQDARESSDFKAYLGFAPEDKVMGCLTIGRYDRSKTFRGSRTPMFNKVALRAD